jgi:hypothetical protein
VLGNAFLPSDFAFLYKMGIMFSFFCSAGARWALGHLELGARNHAIVLGVWEGACLNHLVQVDPDTYDPYIALFLRLSVDVIIQGNYNGPILTLMWSMLSALAVSALGSEHGFDTLSERNHKQNPRRHKQHQHSTSDFLDSSIPQRSYTHESPKLRIQHRTTKLFDHSSLRALQESANFSDESSPNYPVSTSLPPSPPSTYLADETNHMIHSPPTVTSIRTTPLLPLPTPPDTTFGISEDPESEIFGDPLRRLSTVTEESTSGSSTGPSGLSRPRAPTPGKSRELSSTAEDEAIRSGVEGIDETINPNSASLSPSGMFISDSIRFGPSPPGYKQSARTAVTAPDFPQSDTGIDSEKPIMTHLYTGRSQSAEARHSSPSRDRILCLPHPPASHEAPIPAMNRSRTNATHSVWQPSATQIIADCSRDELLTSESDAESDSAALYKSDDELMTPPYKSDDAKQIPMGTIHPIPSTLSLSAVDNIKGAQTPQRLSKTAAVRPVFPQILQRLGPTVHTSEAAESLTTTQESFLKDLDHNHGPQIDVLSGNQDQGFNQRPVDQNLQASDERACSPTNTQDCSGLTNVSDALPVRPRNALPADKSVHSSPPSSVSSIVLDEDAQILRRKAEKLRHDAWSVKNKLESTRKEIKRTKDVKKRFLLECEIQQLENSEKKLHERAQRRFFQGDLIICPT